MPAATEQEPTEGTLPDRRRRLKTPYWHPFTGVRWLGPAIFLPKRPKNSVCPLPLPRYDAHALGKAYQLLPGLPSWICN